MSDFDDCEAYLKYPKDNWIYNKLLLYQKLNYTAAPHGVDPDQFPVISKPIVNIWGQGLGVERWCSAADIKYQAGHLWMMEFSGAWISRDIDFDSGVVWEAQAHCSPVWCANPFAWHVRKKSLADISHKLARELDLLNLSVNKINVETIGENITEIHLRWSYEIAQWYTIDEFVVDVIWSTDLQESVPDGWLELLDENRPLQIAAGKPFRIAHRPRLIPW
jgi:hypothetical protein